MSESPDFSTAATEVRRRSVSCPGHKCPRHPWFAQSWSRALLVPILALALAVGVSCTLGPRRVTSPDRQTQAPPAGHGEKATGLIKPMIPPGRSDAREESSGQDYGSRPTEERTGGAKEPGSPEARKHWEDEKVKRAAVNMAKSFRRARKVKVCYVVDDDEWWVTIYDDLGSSIDLKQYVWDREKEALEPFLVLKRIPRGRMEKHAGEKRPGQACEVINMPARRR